MKHFTLEELWADREFWHEKTSSYSVQTDWTVIQEKPSVYPAFRWRTIYTLYTLRYCFIVTVREVNILRSIVGISPYKGRFQVMLQIGASSCPVPAKIWEKGSSLWREHIPAIDVYYGGEKYKHEFDPKQYGKRGDAATYAAHVCGMDTQEEAETEAQFWMDKVVRDHWLQIENDRALCKKIAAHLFPAVDENAD